MENQDIDSEEVKNDGKVISNNQQEEKGDVAVEEETDSDDGDEFVGNTFLSGDVHNHIATRRDREDDDAENDDDVAAEEELELYLWM